MTNQSRSVHIGNSCADFMRTPCTRGMVRLSIRRTSPPFSLLHRPSEDVRFDEGEMALVRLMHLRLAPEVVSGYSCFGLPYLVVYPIGEGVPMKLSRILASTCAFLAAVGAAGASQAANICNETVQATRTVDGIPAYAQCSDTTNSAIYSNNGIDTSTTSGGTGWVRTQMSDGYQCTELAHRYLYFKWNVAGVPNGNAGFWCDGTIPTGLVKAITPLHGDLIVFAPGSCGADATTGHVAVVDVVNADATVTFVEENTSGRRKCQVSTAACFLHAVANNGVTVDGGVPARGVLLDK